MSDGQSFLWGQSERIKVTSYQTTSLQILQVSLPTPAVCAIYFNAVWAAGSGSVWTLTANLNIGLGRTSLKRTLVWANQPVPGSPIEFILPAQPVGALQLDCTVEGLGGPEFEIAVGAELAPITHIPVAAKTPLKFGMALPGEAEGIDDDAFDELDEYNPELVAQLREMQQKGFPMGALEDLIADSEEGRDRGKHARQMHAEAAENARRVRRFSRRTIR